jgi:putative phosphoribosyl transferase
VFAILSVAGNCSGGLSTEPYKNIAVKQMQEHLDSSLQIPFAGFHLNGELLVPPDSLGVVLFAHGSGSGRFSPRNQFVARTLREHRAGTLLFDLLTEAEEEEDRFTGHLRFDIGLLSQRLLGATTWFHENHPALPIAYFGSSTGAAAALAAAAQSSVPIRAIVSRGGRPDLAGPSLPNVKAPTLLIVGGADTPVISMNEEASAQMRCARDLRIIPGASHLFEEAGALEQVAQMAAKWFQQHFQPKLG